MAVRVVGGVLGLGAQVVTNARTISADDFFRGMFETALHVGEILTAMFAVNVEGVYRTTKAFAPFVMESKGRIITTGSIAGTLSWGGGSAYSGSKHAMEAPQTKRR